MSNLYNELKQLLPYSLRKAVRSWQRRFKYDNPFVGFLFTMTHRYYRVGECRFTIPYGFVGMGFRSRFFFDVYEISGRTLTDKFVKPEDRVVELGACIGIISCITNKILSSQRAKHVVVEANPYLLPWLYENRRLNNSNFLVEFCALSEGSSLDFFLGDLIVAGSIKKDDRYPIRVPARSLSELEQKHGMFDVIIVDIEGAEKDFFRYSERLLKRYRLVIVEFHNFLIGKAAVEECQEILKRNDFVLKEKLGIVEAW